MQYASYDWLLSPRIMFSRFIHVVTRIRTSFLFMAELYSIIWTDHNLLVHSPADGHLSYFHLLAIVNSATMYVNIQVFEYWSLFLTQLGTLYLP